MVGPSLRGAAVWGDAELTPSKISTFAGRAAANASNPSLMRNVYSWHYYLKRWACHGLVSMAPEGPFHVVIMMRPDLFVFQPWRIAFSYHGPMPRRSFLLSVGNDSAVEFDEEHLVMHDFMINCANDWIVVSSFRASTTLEQMIHHLYGGQGFVPCPGQSSCCEVMLAAYLWRVGLPRKLADLHVEMERKLGISGLALNVTALYAQWPENSMYETKHRRRAAVMWGGIWNAYCKDPAYTDFGDESTVLDDGTVSWQRPVKFGGPITPGASVPMGNASNRQCGVNRSSHPPCDDTVDLQVPLKACTRLSIGQRVHAVGHGAAFPWWRTCGSACEPLPRARYFSSDGNNTTATVFPGRDEPRGSARDRPHGK